MVSIKRQNGLRVSAFLLAALLLVTHTACDGDADHYYVIFGPLTPAHQDSSCVTYCVATESTVVSGFFEVARGDVVQFANFTKVDAKVTLEYSYPDGTGSADSFSIGPGKSKTRTIKQNLPTGGTQIDFRYEVSGTPPQGGPGMVVRP